ncbi:DUF2255 family protein [Gryllotalpicola koreensis]|uniref:DUF2255 family protein n=1 Tax=Gryllotalpicola koreensis TaxID=993086 RepID=A0ABP7ZXB7_9MICO
MSNWSEVEYLSIASAVEIEITTRRTDGTLRPWVPIWVIGAGDELYIRSWRGRSAAWFRHVSAHSEARIRAGSAEYDIAVIDVPRDDAAHPLINQEYQRKYARYPTHVPPMLAETAVTATLRLLLAQERHDSQ